MNNINVRQIIELYLLRGGYDGLCCDDCGCEIGDLCPCDGFCGECVAGYKVPCPGPEDCYADGNCPFHISSKKPIVPFKPKENTDVK